ncbi:hypothetical protein JOM56_010195 [Amanita muscaria]
MTVLHLSTLISRSTAPILAHISHLSRTFPAHPLLFSVSHNTASHDDLSNIVKKLTTFSQQTIGCLAAPLPGPYSQFTACSMAIFDPDHVVMFRSTVPGIQQAQVGRWRPVGQPRSDSDENLGLTKQDLSDVRDWEEIWNGNSERAVLLNELQGLSSDDVASIIYLTDRSPEGLSHSLTRFTGASKLGMVASSTPFVTGRPFTLFSNRDIYDSGAVGIVLKNKKLDKVTVKASFLDLEAISEPMTITQCEGNMVISLDNQNPAQFLLSRIRGSGLSTGLTGIVKDEIQFALGVVENGRLNQVFNITAGDPSRGTIALDTPRSPQQGTLVQFFHRTEHTNDPLARHGLYFTPYMSTKSPLYAPKAFNILSVTDGGAATSQVNVSAPVQETFVLGNQFLAVSENGFLSTFGHAGMQGTWMCNLPGSLATVTF